MICFLFIPVHWLFFAASTYVWVQFVWYTGNIYRLFLTKTDIASSKYCTVIISDKGICLPTVSLWLLFVYIEASIRLRELKNLPLHLDLCRPFAAHW